MKNRHASIKSRFTALENQFLNTFFSGIYISAKEFINIGKKVGIPMSMNSRELLIKELLNKSDANATLQQTTQLLSTLIQERVATYHALSKDYPGAASTLAALAQKANATASLLAKEVKGNPYE
ncbi:MAG: hypothetical protein WBK95_09410 [Sulfurimonas sp.]|nr:hypothetical protein [Sulfurimonas sp.]MDD3060472.1 hypothetical protein [Sulfurimonas sp.]MDD5202086.1 hypothetical protein [Sulfurimonas sp.]